MGWAMVLHGASEHHYRIPRSHDEIRETEFDKVIPSLCQKPCLQAYLEAENIGKQPALCSATSNFKPLYSTCKQTCTMNTSNLEDLRRVNQALDKMFGGYTDYCDSVEYGGGLYTPPPTPASGSVVATSDSRLAALTTLVQATATHTVTMKNVGVGSEATGAVGKGEGGVITGVVVNTGVIVGAVVGAAVAVVLMLVVVGLVFRGRRKRRKREIEGGERGFSSGVRSTTIGNDDFVTADKKEEGLAVTIAELDGAPVVKRVEMDVEGSHRELDAEERYKELDVECGYGELDVSEKRLLRSALKEKIDEGEAMKKDNDEDEGGRKSVNGVNKRGSAETKESTGKVNKDEGEWERKAAKSGQAKETKDGIGDER